jgi:hypothetical protein
MQTFFVTVVDTTPPEISRVSASPSLLWPPNHQMVPGTLTVDAVDYCGLVGCKIIGVRDDESRELGQSGRREVDWLVTGDLALLLRAARSDGGAERRYVIDVQCEDAAGNRSQRSVTVTVPHSESVGR